MKFINKQYGIRETEELYRVNIAVMQQNMLFFSLEVTLAKHLYGKWKLEDEKRCCDVCK